MNLAITQWKRFYKFVGDARLELKKVTWPTRPEVIGTTGVVLVIVLIFSVFLYVADIVLGRMVTYIFEIF